MKNVYSGKSKIAGNGIFASRDLKKGEFIFYMRGKKVKKNHDIDVNWCGLNKNLWMNPRFPVLQTNHSCEPNMGIKGSVTFKALRNIKKDEELTFDYSICDEELHWKMNCNCGSRKCRRVVRSIQFLPKNVYASYLPYIPTYFQKVYSQYNRNIVLDSKSNNFTNKYFDLLGGLSSLINK